MNDKGAFRSSRVSHRPIFHMLTWTIAIVVEDILYDSQALILVTSLNEGPVCPCVLRDNFDTHSDMSCSISTAPRSNLLLPQDSSEIYFEELV